MNSMVERCLLPALAGALLTLSIACDDRSSSNNPPPPPPPPTKKPVATKPTTQMILEGPRKRIPLQLIPFSAEVPEGWSIKTYGDSERSVTFLEGPLVNDEAHLTLGLREHMSAEMLKLRIARADKERPQVEKLGGVINVRTTPQMTVVETRKPAPVPTTLPAPAPGEEPLPIDNEKRLDWRIELYVTSGIMYDQSVITVMDMSETSFKTNGKVISDIFASLKYGEESPLTP
jgi:hypothetical protein